MDKYSIFPQCIARESLKIQSKRLLVDTQKVREINKNDIECANYEESVSPIGLDKPNLIISSINNLPKDEFGQDIMLLEKESIKRKAMLVEDILRVLPDKSNEDYKFWLNKLMHEMFTLGSRVQEHNDFVEHIYALRATEKNTIDRKKAGSTTPKAWQPFIKLIQQIVKDIQKDPNMHLASRSNLAEAINDLFSKTTISYPANKSIKKYINESYGYAGKKGKQANAPSLRKVREWVYENYKNKISTKSIN